MTPDRHELSDKVEIANVLHDAMLSAIARLAPHGSGRTIATSAVAEAMIVLLAELLIASKSELPAEELERLTVLFKMRLEQEFAARAGTVVGHA